MPTLKQQLTAWTVHAFTLSGLIFAVLATLALFEGDTPMMWLWLGIALIIDSLDGTMARKAKVKDVIPWFDGGIIDIVVDYLTWTFIPALFMYLYLPLGPKPLAVVLLVLILISSMFCYANENWKSTDYYFIGFPAAWNIVAVVMYVLGTGAILNVAVTLILMFLTVTPTYYTHPFRVKKHMALNIMAISLWLFATTWLVIIAPERPVWLMAIFWVTGGWFAATCIWRTVTGNNRQAQP